MLVQTGGYGHAGLADAAGDGRRSALGLTHRRGECAMLIENERGNFTFIRGIGPFSAGVRAHPGFAIVHAAFRPFVPLARGYELVERHLRELSRPIQALCGMQLRIPRPLSREGFEDFNRPYIEKLRGWGLEVDGANPVTRTNVALEVSGVAEPSLAGFFYATPAPRDVPSWVLSGVPEIASRDGAVKVVAPGDTSAEGLRQKTQCILDILARHLTELRLGWDQATAINLYGVHDLHPLMGSTILPAFGTGARSGITWHYARPPVSGLELEIDGWSVLRDEYLAT